MTEPLDLVSLQEQRESQTILWIVLLTTAITAFAERLLFELPASLGLGVVLGYAPVAISPLLAGRLEVVPNNQEQRCLYSWWLLFATAYLVYPFTGWSYKLSISVGTIVVVAVSGGVYSLGQTLENPTD